MPGPRPRWRIGVLDSNARSRAELLPPDLPAPIVLVLERSTAAALGWARIAGVMGVLLRPLRREELRPTLEIAIARFRELRRLRRVLADRPVVEAAPRPGS
jgi:AmiR/NasT family two-component response regulator